MTRWMKSCCVMLLAASSLLFCASGFAAPLPESSPQTIRQERVKLFFKAAHTPLAILAPEIYQFAASSERCRLNDGAKACGLSTAPLVTSSLDGVFDYYVRDAVEAVLGQRQIKVSKADWTWQAYPSHRP